MIFITGAGFEIIRSFRLIDREVFYSFGYICTHFELKVFIWNISEIFCAIQSQHLYRSPEVWKIAKINSKMDAEDLICSLCLEIFTVPVKITVCGHSFCLQCLTDSMTEATWPCPTCRTIQTKTPEQLPRNFCLEPIVEKYNSSRINICTTHDLQKKLCEYLV